MSSKAWQVFFIIMDNLDAVMPRFCPACDLHTNIICDIKTVMSSQAWQVFFIFMDNLDAVMLWFRPACDLHMSFFIFCIGKERTVIQCDRDRQRWHTHKQTWQDVDRWHMHGLCCKIGTAVPLQHEIPDDLAYIFRHEMAPCYSRVKPGGVKWFIKWVGFVRLKTNSS